MTQGIIIEHMKGLKWGGLLLLCTRLFPQNQKVQKYHHSNMKEAEVHNVRDHFWHVCRRADTEWLMISVMAAKWPLFHIISVQTTEIL